MNNTIYIYICVYIYIYMYTYMYTLGLHYLLVERYLSNTASFVFRGITSPTRLIELYASFATFEEIMR